MVLGVTAQEFPLLNWYCALAAGYLLIGLIKRQEWQVVVEAANLLTRLAEFIQLTVIGSIGYLCVIASALTQLVLTEPCGKISYNLAAFPADKLIFHPLLI